MTLTPGTRLGPYEIDFLLGTGGMGEVYRAHDTRLERSVAIKLLSPSFAERPERRQRFSLEARTISSLQHPHICRLFDVGEEDGHVFLVMEYLEGQTLDDRLSHGPLPAREVLLYASHMASALDHAHRADIIHRDLKPSNVMLTDSGATLLDFGLARAPALAGAGLSTVSLPHDKLTAEGTIVGTFQYMAPEQLEGKEADERTDIFAFGTMLYEMATGRRAFEGKSQASLIASILTEQPPSVSSTRAQRRADGLPIALDHLVERCLAKNPDERWQTARDLKAALAWIADDKAPSTRRIPFIARPGTRETLAWLTAAVAIVAAIAGIAVGRRERPAAALARLAITLPAGSILPRTVADVTYLAVSPDGRHLAFVATAAGVSGLWVQSFDSATPRVLVSGETIFSPFWSPDSRFIGFFAPSDGALKKVELSGGPSRTICATRSSGLARWSADGTILYTEFRQGLFRVSAEGGQPTQVTQVDRAQRELNHYWPSFLPDGRRFLYTATTLDASGRRATPIVYAASLDSDDRKEIARINSRMVYTSSGHVLYIHEGTLLAQAFDAEHLRLTGEPVRIAESIDYTRSTGASAFSVSETGVLAYAAMSDAIELAWFDRSGRSLGSTGTPQRFGHIKISPSGTQVAADVRDPRLGTSDIWTYDLPRGVATRLTTDLNEERIPLWSPDGRRIMFVSDRGTGSDAAGDFFIKRSDALGDEEVFFTRVGPQFLEDWSRDGRLIAYRDESREAGDNLWILPLTGDREPRPFLRSRFEEWGARFSPDSAWIAYVSNESGRFEVYIAPVDGAGPKVQVSTAGGVAPRWRSDGKELFFLNGDSTTVMAASVTFTAGVQTGTPAPLFALTRGTGSRGRPQNVAYDVTPDGARFLFTMAASQAPPAQIAVVLDWQALLPR